MLKKIMILTAGCIMLAGCSSVAPRVNLNQQFWHQPEQVAVARDSTSQATLFMTGDDDGVLEILADAVIDHGFEGYLVSYNVSNALSGLQKRFVSRLNKAGMHASNYKEPILLSALSDSSKDNSKYAVYNYSPLMAKVGKNKLLIITVNRIGAVRSYLFGVPTGAPVAICDLEGHLVNLKNNAILWRYRSNVTVGVQGSWDASPPAYPNFNKALDQAVAQSEQQLIDAFFANAPKQIYIKETKHTSVSVSS